MPRTNLGTAVLTAALATVVVTTACSRDNEKDKPVAQIQTQTPTQVANSPMTVAGCMRAGEASGTFVLTASQADQQGQTATYTLYKAANAPTLDLQQHVGKQVEVSGILRAQQETATLTPAAPAANAKPTGTGGTPTVQTKTEVEFKRLDVTGVRALGDDCAR